MVKLTTNGRPRRFRIESEAINLKNDKGFALDISPGYGIQETRRPE
jgi:hypothetical protein